MDYRLIAIDIDGTLLSSQRIVTPRTERAIKAAVDLGVHVFLCTGRSLHSGRDIARAVHGDTGLVFHSGALILDRLEGSVLRAVNLRHQHGHELISYFKAEGHDPLVYDPVPASRRFHFEAERTPNAWRRRYIEGSRNRAREVADLTTSVDFGPAQVAVSGPKEEMVRLKAHLGSAWPHVGVILSHSTLVDDYWFLEAVPQEVSKSQALSFLGNLYGVQASEMIAVGDNYNDLDMIEYAGLGIAVMNAPMEIQMTADRVAPSNDEEGVASVIEKYLL